MTSSRGCRAYRACRRGCPRMQRGCYEETASVEFMHNGEPSLYVDKNSVYNPTLHALVLVGNRR